MASTLFLYDGVYYGRQSKETIEATMTEHIDENAIIHTDEGSVYDGIDDFFKGHESIRHKGGEFGRGDVTTNGIESVWAVLKRGILGVCHHIDKNHIQRYVDEFSFRLNDGNVEIKTMDRIESIVKGSFGKRLTYKRLVG